MSTGAPTGGRIGATFASQIANARKTPALWLLGVASLLLSIGSFYTTFLGMFVFMDVLIVNAFITFGVQSIMLVTAWMIGFAQADPANRRVSPFLLFLFAISLAVSVFFSFAQLFQVVNGDYVTSTRDRFARDAAVQALNAGKIALDRVSLERGRELSGSTAYTDWRNRVMAVISAAETSRTTLEDVSRAQAQQATQSIVERDSEIARLEVEIANLKSRVDATTSSNSNLTAALSEAEAELESARVALQAVDLKLLTLDTRITAEERGERGTRPGCGPICRGLKVERVALVEERIPIFARFETAEEKVKTLRDQLSAVGPLNPDDVVALAEKEARLRALRSEAVNSPGDGGAPVLAPSALDVSASATAITRAFEGFGGPGSDEAVATILNACNELLGTMRALPALTRGLDAQLTLPSIDTLSCDTGGMEALVAAYSAVETARGNFFAKCSAEAGAVAGVAVMDATAALTFARECLSITGLGNEPEIIRATSLLRDTEANRGEKTHPFQLSILALQERDSLAWLALFIAFTMDLLVYASGRVGAQSLQTLIGADEELWLQKVFEIDMQPGPHDTPPILAAKRLLALMEPFESDTLAEGYHFKIDTADEDQRVSEQLRAILLGFGAANAQAFDGSRSIFAVTDKVKRRLTQEILDHQERTRQLLPVRAETTVVAPPDDGVAERQAARPDDDRNRSARGSGMPGGPEPVRRPPPEDAADGPADRPADRPVRERSRPSHAENDAHEERRESEENERQRPPAPEFEIDENSPFRSLRAGTRKRERTRVSDSSTGSSVDRSRRRTESEPAVRRDPAPVRALPPAEVRPSSRALTGPDTARSQRDAGKQDHDPDLHEEDPG